jgi:hypothetical protein
MKTSRLAAVLSLAVALAFICSVFGEPPKQAAQVPPQEQVGTVETSQHFSVLYNFDAKCVVSTARHRRAIDFVAMLCWAESPFSLRRGACSLAKVCPKNNHRTSPSPIGVVRN